MNNENNKKEKRSIWRRPLTYIMLVVILILGALAGGSVWLLSAQSNTQRLNMAGYARPSACSVGDPLGWGNRRVLFS